MRFCNVLQSDGMSKITKGHRGRPRDHGSVQGRSGRRREERQGERRSQFSQHFHHIREGRGHLDQPHWQIEGQGEKKTKAPAIQIRP